MINMNTSMITGYGAGYGTGYGNAYSYGLSIGQENSPARGWGLTDEEKDQRGIQNLKGAEDSEKAKVPKEIRDSDKAKGSRGIKDPGEECQTCKNRKYKDGSDEMVSFKTAQHVSPEAAASRVRSHEQEHVSNAYTKAAQNNGKVVQASVSIHMAVCPECGRSYVSGGTTHTQIKYYNEDNPYQKDLRATDHDKYAGMNLDYSA